MEKSLADAEAHRVNDIKDIQNKMEALLKEKEDSRKEI
jgi:hypothetical protein